MLVEVLSIENALVILTAATSKKDIAHTNKIFTIENANESEAFGIRREDAGVSEPLTLEQLYTLRAEAAN